MNLQKTNSYDPGGISATRSVIALLPVILLPLILILSVSAQTWEKYADYQPNNPFVDLEITDVRAEYVPFFHDPNKPDDCLDSRINFWFTVTNKGKQPQKLPRLLRFETNSPKPWMRRTDSTAIKPEEDVSMTGSIKIRGSMEVVLKPGESTVLTTFRLPPDGPWNPMNLEARLVNLVFGEETFVGARQPFSRTITVDAPDYVPVKMYYGPADGRTFETAKRFLLAAYWDCIGKRVGGPVRMVIDVKELGGNGSSLLVGREYDIDTELVLFSESVLAIGRPDFNRVQSTIRVGCPIHKFQQGHLRDANPSNDSKFNKPTLQVTQ